jgi:hypothetical protein
MDDLLVSCKWAPNTPFVTVFWWSYHSATVFQALIEKHLNDCEKLQRMDFSNWTKSYGNTLLVQCGIQDFNHNSSNLAATISCTCYSSLSLYYWFVLSHVLPTSKASPHLRWQNYSLSLSSTGVSKRSLHFEPCLGSRKFTNFVNNLIKWHRNILLNTEHYSNFQCWVLTPNLTH